VSDPSPSRFDPNPPPRRGLARWRRGGPTDGDDLPIGPSVNSAKVALAVILGIVLVACGFMFWRGEGEIKKDRARSGVTTLTRGQCVNEVNGRNQLAKVTVVDCAQPHEAEVFATLTLQGRSEYPTVDEVDAEISPQCFDAFEAYAPAFIDDETIEINYIVPDSGSWVTGDRRVTCLALNPSGKRTGSLH
jgi:hypothetical protein